MLMQPGSPTAPPPSIDVLGIPIHAVTIASAARTITDMAKQGMRGTVAVAAVHSIVDAQSDPDAKRAMAGATLCVPDGMPLVWLLKLHGKRAVSRVFGPDLMLEVSRLMAMEGLSAFYFGGHGGVADELADRLGRDYPGLRCAGTLSPPFRELDGNEKSAVAAAIDASGADIVWVGLGSPKQERWMAEFRPRLNAPVLIGIGAAFDYNTGRLTRAPRWMQTCALEWLYRLIQEPRRLWRRYLRNNPLFLWHLMCQRLGLRSFGGQPARLPTPLDHRILGGQIRAGVNNELPKAWPDRAADIGARFRRRTLGRDTDRRR